MVIPISQISIARKAAYDAGRSARACSASSRDVLVERLRGIISDPRCAQSLVDAFLEGIAGRPLSKGFALRGEPAEPSTKLSTQEQSVEALALSASELGREAFNKQPNLAPKSDALMLLLYRRYPHTRLLLEMNRVYLFAAYNKGWIAARDDLRSTGVRDETTLSIGPAVSEKKRRAMRRGQYFRSRHHKERLARTKLKPISHQAWLSRVNLSMNHQRRAELKGLYQQHDGMFGALLECPACIEARLVEPEIKRVQHITRFYRIYYTGMTQ